jgi:hypothetical protein
MINVRARADETPRAKITSEVGKGVPGSLHRSDAEIVVEIREVELRVGVAADLPA